MKEDLAEILDEQFLVEVTQAEAACSSLEPREQEQLTESTEPPEATESKGQKKLQKGKKYRLVTKAKKIRALSSEDPTDT